MERKARIAGPRLRQQPGRRIKSDGGISVGGEPGDFPTAAAADVGRQPGAKELPDVVMKISGRRLLMPVGVKGFGRSVLRSQGLRIHSTSSGFDPLTIKRSRTHPARSRGALTAIRAPSGPPCRRRA